ncbi:MAG: hypothetical protein ACRDRS_01805 [Pseudonocardiaceae bacterium]
MTEVLEMSLIQVGLVDKTGELDAGLVQTVAAALNVQVMRDLPQFWGVQATVLYLPHPTKIPPGVWPVFLVDDLPPGEGGVHQDKNNQPYAKVVASPDNDGWTVAASHEVVEMLVDPGGNRMQTSRSIEIVDGDKIQDGPSEFQYLVEACDPCESDDFAYLIQGVAVSDFLTPHFYDPVVTQGTRYSFTGALTAPRQILPGGYISWVDPASDTWQQLRWIDPKEDPNIVDLGPAQGTILRSWIDGLTARTNLRTTTRISRDPVNHSLLDAGRARRARLERMAKRRAAQHFE